MSVVISSALVLSDGGDYPLRLPRLCVRKIGGTITASGAEDGFPASRADSPMTYTGWRADALPATWEIDAGEAVSCDYCGIAGHDLGTVGATVQPQYSTDGVTWEDAADEYLPGDTEPVLFLFSEISARYWRLRVTGTTVPSISVIQFGQATAFPNGLRPGYAPGPWNREIEYANTFSEGGQILGRSQVRRGTEQAIRIDLVRDSWVRANWPALQSALRTNGAFWAAFPEAASDEVVYGITEREPRASYSQGPDFCTLDIRLVGQ